MKKGRCLLIDIAVLRDGNVVKKEAEKILKCKDFTIEIQRVWNVKKRKWYQYAGNCNHVKIVQKKRTRKTHQATTENSHAGHCAHLAGSVIVKV
jgi:lipopolysaccharide export system protein LptA